METEEVELEFLNPPESEYLIEAERVLTIELGAPTPPTDEQKLIMEVFLDSCEGESLLGCLDDDCPAGYEQDVFEL